jgi:dihydropteroate synthase
VAAAQLIVDPGIGFAKNAEHNWELLRRIDELQALQLPVLIGASRKSFLGQLLGDADRPRPPKERDDASVALTTWLAERGVWGLRVHTARPHRDAIAVAGRLQSGPGAGP